nr:MAG TPA: hypothetical protein [Caudoviricetes sp.]
MSAPKIAESLGETNDRSLSVRCLSDERLNVSFILITPNSSEMRFIHKLFLF